MKTTQFRCFPLVKETDKPEPFLWIPISAKIGKMAEQRNGRGNVSWFPFLCIPAVSLVFQPFLWSVFPFLCIKKEGCVMHPDFTYSVISVPSLKQKTILPSMRMVTWSIAFSHKSSENSVITSCTFSVSA